MENWTLYHWTCASLIVIAGLVAISLIFVTAPYGRYDRKGWGPEMDERFGWMIMEAISPLAFVMAFFQGGGHGIGYILLAMFCGHYAYRAFIYPFRMRGTGTKPVATVAMASVFNIANGSINGWGVATAAHLTEAWLGSGLFILGIGMFAAGVTINHQSDAILRHLRGPGETGYKVPEGGLFRFVTAPNYLGELIEWIGFALAASTLAGWTFVIFTAANLVPRAVSHHAWYKRTFPNYPGRRRAILPFLL